MTEFMNFQLLTPTVFIYWCINEQRCPLLVKCILVRLHLPSFYAFMLGFGVFFFPQYDILGSPIKQVQQHQQYLNLLYLNSNLERLTSEG